jgi:MinD-like ATPase involved in chromosome partitioning or flagellar assembly
MVSIHLFLALAAFSIVDAATTVAVLEFGKSGSVRRTLSSNSGTTVAGATSFFQSLSGKGLQHSDMTMVPDLFHKPDGVVIVEISGAGGNLHSMPVVSELLSNEGKNHVVGHMTLPGSNHHSALMNRVGPAKKSECSSFVSDIKKEATTPALSVVSIHADSSNAAEIDSKIAGMMSALQQQASSQGTIVVHLVVEEDEISAHRRLSEAVSSNNSEKSKSMY